MASLDELVAAAIERAFANQITPEIRALREEVRALKEDGDPNVLVDVKEAARLLGTTEGALRRRLERGRGPLRPVHVGRSVRLRRADILALARSRGER